MMWKYITVTSVLLLLILGIFSFFVSRGFFDNFDLAVITGLQKIIPQNWNIPLSFFSLIGSFEATFTLLVVVLIKRKWLEKFFVIGLFGFGHIIEILGKNLIYHPGPPSIFFRYSLPFLFPTSYVETSYSFPSGHALRTAFLTFFIGILIFKSNKMDGKIKISVITALVIFTLVMLISRVSLGEHWMSDVIAGAFLGSTLGLIAGKAITLPQNIESIPPPSKKED